MSLVSFLAKSHVSNLLHVLNLLLLYNLKNFNSTFNLPPKYFTFGEYLLIYIMSFFVNPTVKTIIVVFLLNIQFIIAFFYFFFNSKLFLICFLLFFLANRFNNFFSIKITNSPLITKTS